MRLSSPFPSPLLQRSRMGKCYRLDGQTVWLVSIPPTNCVFKSTFMNFRVPYRSFSSFDGFSVSAIDWRFRLEQVISEQDLRTMRVLRIFRAFWKHWEWASVAASESINSITHHPFSKDTLIFLANSFKRRRILEPLGWCWMSIWSNQHSSRYVSVALFDWANSVILVDLVIL